MADAISFGDVEKLDLRIGKVESAEPIEGAKKLLKLIVDFGDQKLQAVSGISKHYTPEQVVGQEFLFITNLERRQIMGMESQCMIFAAEDGENVVLLKPEKEVSPGSRVG